MKEYPTLEYQNFKSYVCDLSDLDEIKEIYASWDKVNGCLKTEGFTKRINELFLKILSKTDDERLVLGVRNLKTNQLLGYSVIRLPKESCFMFLQFGESYRSKSKIFGEDRAIYGLYKLATLIAESQGRFDYFWLTRLKNFFPQINLIKRQNIFEKEPSRYTYSINSIVKKNSTASTTIQKILVRDENIDRDFDAVIIHGSLKPEYRLEYFKDFLTVKNNS
jgi:hypothetical protein